MTWARTEITKNLELNSECLKKVKEREKRENNISPKYLKKTLSTERWSMNDFRRECHGF